MGLVRAYSFADLLSLVRDSKAWCVDGAGALVEHPAGALRVDHDPVSLAWRGWLVEGEGGNRNTNSLAKGAVPGVSGSGGALPTGWSGGTANMPPGALTVIGPQRRRGVDGVAIRVSGVPTGTASVSLFAETPTIFPLGTVVANRLFTELIAGSLTNVTGWQLRPGNQNEPPIAPPGAFAEIKHVSATTTTGSATALKWNYIDAVTPVDFTLWIGWPTREHAAFVSSPVLLTDGTLGPSTRAADDLSLTDIVRWFNAAAGTFVMDFTPGQAAADTLRGLLALDDGTDGNMLDIAMPAASNIIRLSAASGGTTVVAALDAGSAAALARHTLRVSYGPAGYLMSLNGAAAVTAAGPLPVGINVARLGRRHAGASGQYLNGWLGPRFAYYAAQYTEATAADGFTIRNR